MKWPLESLSVEGRTALEEAFSDRLAARALADPDTATAEAGATTSERSQLASAVLAAVKGQGSLNAVLAGATTVPMNLLGLVRRAASRNARAASLGARAASTDDGPVRDLGDSRLSMVEEQDALFIMIDLGGEMAEAPPARLRAIGADGALLAFDLPEPIGGMVQFGLMRAAVDFATNRATLFDPETALFLE